MSGNFRPRAMLHTIGGTGLSRASGPAALIVISLLAPQRSTGNMAKTMQVTRLDFNDQNSDQR